MTQPLWPLLIRKLLVARVKRILQLDDDINACSANGAFVITVATVSITILKRQISAKLIALIRRCSSAISQSNRST